MEDALALSIVQDEATYKACLNPCCNGRCTRTTTVREFSCSGNCES